MQHSGAGRNAKASIVRNWYTSYFDLNFAENSEVVMEVVYFISCIILITTCALLQHYISFINLMLLKRFLM